MGSIFNTPKIETMTMYEHETSQNIIPDYILTKYSMLRDTLHCLLAPMPQGSVPIFSETGWRGVLPENPGDGVFKSNLYLTVV